MFGSHLPAEASVLVSISAFRSPGISCSGKARTPFHPLPWPQGRNKECVTLLCSSKRSSLRHMGACQPGSRTWDLKPRCQVCSEGGRPTPSWKKKKKKTGCGEDAAPRPTCRVAVLCSHTLGTSHSLFLVLCGHCTCYRWKVPRPACIVQVYGCQPANSTCSLRISVRHFGNSPDTFDFFITTFAK